MNSILYNNMHKNIFPDIYIKKEANNKPLITLNKFLRLTNS